MERQKKIIDASVMVKIFAKEENSEKAIELITDHVNERVTLIVPELIFMETLNALRYKKLEQEILEKANKDMWNFQLEIIGVDKFLLDKAINASKECDLSIYDAVYTALSQTYGTQLITADEKLLKTPNAVSLDKT